MLNDKHYSICKTTTKWKDLKLDDLKFDDLDYYKIYNDDLKLNNHKIYKMYINNDTISIIERVENISNLIIEFIFYFIFYFVIYSIFIYSLTT